MRWIALTIVVLASAAAASMQSGRVKPAERQEAIRHAQLWAPTDIPSMDLKAGPAGPEAFAPGQIVECDYVDKALNGKSPKFTCAIDGKEFKVKYGAANGEVFAEVAATRLLWALGFGADAMYPVRVNCHGCPPNFTGKPTRGKPPVLVDPATIERKMPGHAIETKEDSGWDWTELDLIDESAGGAPRAHRDALRLLATMLQHTDTKPAQQRIVCPKHEGNEPGSATCASPLMIINDLGLTFGHANAFNANNPGSVNFEEWSHAKVWAESRGCVTDLKKSVTGTLDHPVISEAGRKFLADLLAQLSDQQLHDLFEVARFPMRSKHSVEEWVEAFKRKRDEIAARTCPA